MKICPNIKILLNPNINVKSIIKTKIKKIVLTGFRKIKNSHILNEEDIYVTYNNNVGSPH